ncbi:MAG: DNA replication and repair protein RecF, partial [Lachnospiraceae bacterium]|nr:DNA replication and repair protein RecF [Lachnospiraceae bacterium]
MIIKKLELNNFRNYESLEVELDSGINIFYGDNAQGKTNILEALYMGCTTKSHKATRDSEVIRFGEKEAHLRMYVEKAGIERKIDMHLKKNGPKGVALDGIPLAKAAEIYGMMNIISFSPDDLSIIKNGPAERRSFIDMALSQLDKMYLYSLSSYKKSLNQRNILLKQIKSNDELENTLSVWDEQLAKYGEYIINRRSDYIKEIGEIAADIHGRLSGGKEKLKLKYLP